MVKAIMHGCNGHMGRVITDIIKNTEGIELVAGIDKYTKVPNDYPVFESISACDVDADVIIDFSNAAAADELLDYCVEKQVPVVLCTTGLSEEQLAKVEESAKKVAVLKSANMSLGINLLMKILKDTFPYSICIFVKFSVFLVWRVSFYYFYHFFHCIIIAIVNSCSYSSY